MSIPENEIHIYRSPVESTSKQLKESESLLSPDELQKAYRYKFDKDKSHYITGRALLRNILSKYLSQSPDKIIFSYSEKGKPYIKASEVKFNLAHSGGKAIYAIARDIEVGVDIEYMRDLRDALQIAKRFFSEAEVKELSEVNEDDIRAAFFNCWTRKEAFIKALGNGLSYPLADFSVTFRPGEEPGVKWIKDKNEDVNNWSMFEIDIEGNYISSLAVRAKDVNIVFR